MKMTANEKRLLDREALRSVIQQWNANRLDLFELSEPDENLQFHGVMRFYFQDAGQKVATKCIRVASDATVQDVIETLIEKFRPDMRMLSLPNYALYEVHSNHEERKLNGDEKPLLVQLNWHIDDREGRFLLRNTDQKTNTLESGDNNFKRKLSKREKKEQKKKEKLQKMQSTNTANVENHVAEKLYTELPETSFTRSISNPEAVMRRRRQQKLEKKLQQFRSKDGGPDTGGTLKIYGESLCRDVPYKTLLLSIRDCAQAVVREMLAKYGLDKTDPLHYCLVQVNSDGTEYILDDDECPLSILMNHPTSRGSIMFHVRRRPADSQPRRRKKKPLGVSNGSNNMSAEREGPTLVEVTHSGDGGRRIKLGSEPVEVGSANTNTLQLFGPLIQARHCLISLHEGVCTVTPLHADALTFVNGHHIQQPTILHNGSVVMFGRVSSYRFVDSPSDGRYNLALSQSQLDSACLYDRGKIQAANEAGQEPILPAVLEFPETHQEAFLRQVIPDLDVNAPYFKLAPVYTLYLCARYRASTHYRPDLQPTERAHKLTAFLHHVANMIYTCVQEQYTDPKVVSFWMANSSEFLHFLKSDRHISAFSLQAQEVLAETVQSAFRHLVNSFQAELSQTLNQFLSENIDHDSAAGLVLTVLGADMALLRRCRVNAALTIQLFSQLFHYINVVCFNKIVTTPQMCNATWGKVVSDRLQLLELWAERLGLELAADCHLAKINQCAQFLQAPKTTVTEVQQLAHSCFRLNSLQMAALLSQEPIPRSLVDTALRMAESVADELTLSDGREVRLEESTDTQLALLLPEDGFSCDVVRGIPAGLVDFLTPLQNAGMCRLAAQPTSIGLWTVYMHQYNQRSPSAMSTKMPQPDIQVIKLHKNNGGMGLSIVAAKGAGQERLGIYIKSVVPGGAADADGRLQAGDQLLRVDGQSLIGITQERAADYLVRTGPVVTLEVAKQGAIYHGLATLLQQPSPVIQRGTRRMSERDVSRVGAETTKPPLPSPGGQQLLNSKSVPALHHVGNIGMAGNKSRSIHNLAAGQVNDQGFYQNLSIYRGQNISQPNLGDRPPMPLLQPASSSASQMVSPPLSNSVSNQQLLSRPASAYFNSNMSSNTLPSPQTAAMSYSMQQQQQQPRPKNSFLRESQGQQSLRMNQMLAPSMPNIAHSSGYASNISASQSMQNVNMISYPTYPAGQQPVVAAKPPTGHQHVYSPPDQAAQMRMQAKMSEMGEMLRRRNQREMMAPMGMLDMSSSPLAPIQQGSPMAGKPPMMSPTGGAAAMYGQQPYPPPQQQMSPLKQLPPTAPKPQHHRPLPPPDEQLSPPLPPSSTHPLYKPQYVAGNADPPKGYYPLSSARGPNKAFPSSSMNPWEREEREKEEEMRREYVRQRREQQINELSGLPHRTPQQEEELKTMVLERDFERRAQEPVEAEEEPDASAKALGESHVPVEATVMQPKSILKHNSATRMEAPVSEGRGSLLGTGSVPNSPSKQTKSASFADQQQIHDNNSTALLLSKEMSHLHVADVSPGAGYDQEHQGDSPRESFEVTSNGGPPPPPERNSSYIVMSQQQQKLRNSQNLPQKPPQHLELNKKPVPMVNNNFSPLSSFNRDNKRVSFHDQENNVVAGAPAMVPEQADLEIIHEDPNKFIQDTTALLQTPTTPENESWNSHNQQTPGVIGAQEVYLDPRARRLAEQQKNQKSNDTLPEKLTFKEKMKMFALESGENQTPKDKLKISRAQRDIDAVH
ncbi:afadin isoform X4 [Phlebotomus argentipes]|uniref:afadin isoform X4 n=1 Tax=Phlebotomus argentipes TaxID=94469 RepID=UPI002892BB33|nr:afadin isoform X4 [Phlebotomus argentipes]